jgi:hypothetical protein
LPARRPERPKRCELARPLCDGDRKRVRDHEAANEKGDAAETEQELLEEGDEFVGVLGVLVCLRLARTHLSCGRKDLLDLLQQRVIRDARLRRHRDLVELPRSVEQLLRGRQIETGQRRAADRRDRAELDQSRDAQPSNRSLGLYADRLADLEVLLVGGRLVDHDLVPVWPASLDQRERVERR